MRFSPIVGRSLIPLFSKHPRYSAITTTTRGAFLASHFPADPDLLTLHVKDVLDMSPLEHRTTVIIPSRLTDKAHELVMHPKHTDSLTDEQRYLLLARYNSCLMHTISVTHREYLKARTSSDITKEKKAHGDFMKVMQYIRTGHIGCVQKSLNNQLDWVSFTNNASVGSLTRGHDGINTWRQSWRSSLVNDEKNHALILTSRPYNSSLYTSQKYLLGHNHCSHAAIANDCEIPQDVYVEAITEARSDKLPIGPAIAAYRIIFMHSLESNIATLAEKPRLLREIQKILLTRNLKDIGKAITDSAELTAHEKEDYDKKFIAAYKETLRFKDAFSGEMLGLTDVYSKMAPNASEASEERYFDAVRILVDTKSWIQSEFILNPRVEIMAIEETLAGAIPAMCFRELSESRPSPSI